MIKKNFCVIDIETLGLSARPESFVLGCVYGYTDSGIIKKSFFNREEMIKYIFNNNDFKYVFAHNAEYDYTCLFDNIIINLDNSALFVGSMFISAKKDGIKFMNSLAILKTTVESLGKNYGVEKMTLDDKFKTAKPGDKIEVNENDIIYCFRDCEIVYDYLVKIFEITGKMKPTIASCAMEIFTKNFLQRKFEYNKYNEIFRNSYYGGRVECFRFGKIKPCYKYDVNSLYPKVCTDMYFPDFNKIKKGKVNDKGRFVDMILPNYEGCAKVTIFHRDNFIGTLPLRKESEIIYPQGRWTAFYNFNELRSALKHGFVEIEKVHSYYYAPKMFFSELRNFMIYFFDKKDNTAGAEQLINKFILNSLTGKFAQKEHGEKRYFEKSNDCFRYLESLSSKPRYVIHSFSEQRDDVFLEMFRKNTAKKSRWNIATISSYITSEARVYMLNYYLKYQNKICYTDTDSLVLSSPMTEVSGRKMGEFKKELDEEIDIIGNKHYYTKIKKRKIKYIKGVHKVHKKKKGKFVFKAMVKTKTSLRRNLNAGDFIEVEKMLTNDYSKRTLKKNKTFTLNINDYEH